MTTHSTASVRGADERCQRADRPAGRVLQAPGLAWIRSAPAPTLMFLYGYATEPVLDFDVEAALPFALEEGASVSFPRGLV